MNLMRYTIIDQAGAVSFVADCEVMHALVATCSQNPQSLAELLQVVDAYHQSLREYVLCGLAVFDEHNVEGHCEAIHAALRVCRPQETPVFRVLDEVTRQASLQPVKAGIILFNLASKRIVQVMNSYREIQREGRGRIYDGQRLTGKTFSYRLPQDWALVP